MSANSDATSPETVASKAALNNTVMDTTVKDSSPLNSSSDVIKTTFVKMDKALPFEGENRPSPTHPPNGALNFPTHSISTTGKAQYESVYAPSPNGPTNHDVSPVPFKDDVDVKTAQSKVDIIIAQILESVDDETVPQLLELFQDAKDACPFLENDDRNGATKCMAVARCDTGQTDYRKAISDFFGRNKRNAQQIPASHQVIWCRKHYQRNAYQKSKVSDPETDSSGKNKSRVKITWIVVQLLLIALWREDSAFEIKLQQTEQARLDAANDAHGPKTVNDPTKNSKARNPSRASRKHAKTGRKNSKSDKACSLDILDEFLQVCGTKKTLLDCLLVVNDMKTEIEGDSSGYLPGIEFLLQCPADFSMHKDASRVSKKSRSSMPTPAPNSEPPPITTDPRPYTGSAWTAINAPKEQTSSVVHGNNQIIGSKVEEKSTAADLIYYTSIKRIEMSLDDMRAFLMLRKKLYRGEIDLSGDDMAELERLDRAELGFSAQVTGHESRVLSVPTMEKPDNEFHRSSFPSPSPVDTPPVISTATQPAPSLEPVATTPSEPDVQSASDIDSDLPSPPFSRTTPPSRKRSRAESDEDEDDAFNPDIPGPPIIQSSPKQMRLLTPNGKYIRGGLRGIPYASNGGPRAAKRPRFENGERSTRME
jgi:hypothetical protein